jgi:hypothetical protein
MHWRSSICQHFWLGMEYFDTHLWIWVMLWVLRWIHTCNGPLVIPSLTPTYLFGKVPHLVMMLPSTMMVAIVTCKDSQSTFEMMMLPSTTMVAIVTSNDSCSTFEIVNFVGCRDTKCHHVHIVIFFLLLLVVDDLHFILSLCFECF